MASKHRGPWGLAEAARIHYRAVTARPIVSCEAIVRPNYGVPTLLWNYGPMGPAVSRDRARSSSRALVGACVLSGHRRRAIGVVGAPRSPATLRATRAPAAPSAPCALAAPCGAFVGPGGSARLSPKGALVHRPTKASQGTTRPAAPAFLWGFACSLAACVHACLLTLSSRRLCSYHS